MLSKQVAFLIDAVVFACLNQNKSKDLHWALRESSLVQWEALLRKRLKSLPSSLFL